MQKFYRLTHYFLALYENDEHAVCMLLFDLYKFWIGFGTLYKLIKTEVFFALQLIPTAFAILVFMYVM